MSAYIEYQVKAYTAGEAIDAYVRVKKSGSNVVIAGAGEAGIGVTMANVANGGKVPVRLFNSFGTALMKASAPVVQNAPIYGAASGKIDDSGTGPILGYAEEAATADGDVIEVLLVGKVQPNAVAGVDQAVPTDLPTALAWIASVRPALVASGIIKGAA